jgi:hypothetical protein
LKSRNLLPLAKNAYLRKKSKYRLRMSHKSGTFALTKNAYLRKKSKWLVVDCNVFIAPPFLTPNS